MNRLIYQYGLIAGCLLVGLNFAYYLFFGEVTDFYLGEIVGYAAIVLAMLGVYFGTKRYRDYRLKGYISFGKALQVGLAIAFFPAAAFGLYNYVYFTVLDPGFVQKYYDYSRQSILESSMGEAEKQAKMLEVERMMADPVYSSEAFQAALMFCIVFLIGLAVSLISALVLKKNNHITQQS